MLTTCFTNTIISIITIGNTSIREEFNSIRDINNTINSDISNSKNIAKSVGKLVNPLSNIINIRPQINKMFLLDRESININSPSNNTGYMVTIVPCNPSDVFTINASGRSSARPWGFVASDGTILDRTQNTSSSYTTIIRNKLLVAPENSAYLIIHNRTDEEYFDSFYGAAISPYEFIDKSFISNAKNDIYLESDDMYSEYPLNELKIKIPPFQIGLNVPSSNNIRTFHPIDSTIKVYHTTKNILPPASDVSFIDGQYILDTGEIGNLNALQYMPYYIPIEPAVIYRFQCRNTSANQLNYAFTLSEYDENKQFIQRIQLLNVIAPGVNEAREFIPQFSTRYIRFNIPKSFIDNMQLEHSDKCTDVILRTKNKVYTVNLSTVPTCYGCEIDLIKGECKVTHGHISSYSGENIPGKWLSSIDEYKQGTLPSIGAEVVYELTSPTIYSINKSVIMPFDGRNCFMTDYISSVNIETSYIVDIVKHNELLANKIKQDIIKTKLKTIGQSNFIARVNQLVNVKWVPTAPIPICTGSGKYEVVSPGTILTGIPYSSTRIVSKYVGETVSLWTFLSAVQNPRSVLYTRRIIAGTLGSTYYGINCTIFATYAYAKNDIHNYVAGMYIRNFCTQVQENDMEPGDFMYMSSHVKTVIAVERDEYYKLKYFITAEGSVPYCNKKICTLRNLENLVRQGYTFWRPNFINEIDYKPFDFVKGYPDEEDGSPNYPDIMSEYGDEACIEAGIDVTINVINTKTYNMINIYRNDGTGDTLIDSRNTISDFTLNDIDYGTYTIEITDGTSTSKSKFIAVDMNCSYNKETKTVTFSSLNADPVSIQEYGDANDDETDKAVYGYPYDRHHIFTDEEKAAGTITFPSSDSTNQILINFVTEYGTAVWVSKPLNIWVPFDGN